LSVKIQPKEIAVRGHPLHCPQIYKHRFLAGELGAEEFNLNRVVNHQTHGDEGMDFFWVLAPVLIGSAE